MMSVFSGALLLAVGMGFGRLLGLVRDYLVVSLLGVGESSDFFIMLATLPDTLMFWVGGSVFASVVVPWYRTGSDLDSVRNWLGSASWMIGFSIVVAVSLSLFHDSFAQILIPSLSKGALDEFSGYIVIVLLLFPIVVMTQLRSCFLQCRLQFRRISLSTPLYNLTFILVIMSAAAVNLSFQQMIVSAVVIAVIVRAAFMIYGTKFGDFIDSGQVPQKPEMFNFRYYGQAGLVGAALVLLPVIVRAMESSGGDGAATYFHLGWRLYEFAFGLVCYSVANSVIPRLNNDEANGQYADAPIAVVIILLASFAIGAYVGSNWLGSLLATLISADGVDASMLSAVIQAYAPSMVFYGVVIFISTVLIAQSKALDLLWSIALGVFSLIGLWALDVSPQVTLGVVALGICIVQFYQFARDFAVSIREFLHLVAGLCFVSVFWVFVYHFDLVGIDGWSSFWWSIIAGLSMLIFGFISSGTLRRMAFTSASRFLR